MDSLSENIDSSSKEWAITAARIDIERGISEVASFFGDRDERIFGTRYVPAGEARAALVICCPLQAELLRNYRREVLLARSLAEAGVAAQRFHYRGSGHSDGATSDMTLARMVEDALVAAEEAEQRSGATTIAFMGTRWGALVAARAARMLQAPLILWEPVTHPARYFDEILRFRLMHEMNSDPTTTVGHDDLVAELRGAGSVDVLGHTLERSLYDSATSEALAGIVAEIAAPSLLVQIGVGRSLRNEYKSLSATMHDVTTHVVPDRETWWISGDRWPVHETHPPTQKLIDVTTSWAVSKLGALESTR